MRTGYAGTRVGLSGWSLTILCGVRTVGPWAGLRAQKSTLQSLDGATGFARDFCPLLGMFAYAILARCDSFGILRLTASGAKRLLSARLGCW